jgi:hypothetical protein
MYLQHSHMLRSIHACGTLPCMGWGVGLLLRDVASAGSLGNSCHTYQTVSETTSMLIIFAACIPDLSIPRLIKQIFC